jgi:hypothetical protein
MPEVKDFFARGLKFLPLLPILTKTGSLRQITVWRDFGNALSGNRTV